MLLNFFLFILENTYLEKYFDTFLEYKAKKIEECFNLMFFLLDCYKKLGQYLFPSFVLSLFYFEKRIVRVYDVVNFVFCSAGLDLNN